MVTLNMVLDRVEYIPAGFTSVSCLVSDNSVGCQMCYEGSMYVHMELEVCAF